MPHRDDCLKLCSLLIRSIKKLNSYASVQEISEFFTVTQSINASIVLLRKYYFDKIRPHLEKDRNYQTLCQKKNSDLLQDLEVLIVEGLDKVLVAQISQVGKILSKGQKRSDFRPSSSQPPSLHASKVCLISKA